MRIFALLQLLRPHQWVKNLLVFVPLFTSHSWTQSDDWFSAAVSFMALCFLASAGYALNDAMDVDRDRAHPEKSQRPIAQGNLPVWAGYVVFILFTGLGFSVVLIATGEVSFSPTLWFALFAYLLGTFFYSLWLKRVAIVDTIVLSLLYVVRIVAGAGAISVVMSPWLLAFAGFVFLSLALMKRVVEFQRHGDNATAARPYRFTDLPLLQSAGVATSIAAVLVLALYAQSADVRRLYSTPHFIFIMCPIMTYWLLRIWLKAGRGELPGDPVLFAIQDGLSWITGALILAIAVWAL